MAIAFNDTATTDKETALTLTVNLPANISAGDMLCVDWATEGGNRKLNPPSGWAGTYIAPAGTDFISGVLWIEATGSEGSTLDFDVHRISDDTNQSGVVQAVATRITGVDLTDPFDSDNDAAEYSTSQDPWTCTANTITGIGAGNMIMMASHCNANRALTTADAALTNTVSGVGGNGSIHVFADETPAGTGNAAYSNDMASAREHLDYFYELVPAGGSAQTIILSTIDSTNAFDVSAVVHPEIIQLSVIDSINGFDISSILSEQLIQAPLITSINSFSITSILSAQLVQLPSLSSLNSFDIAQVITPIVISLVEIDSINDFSIIQISGGAAILFKGKPILSIGIGISL